MQRVTYLDTSKAIGMYLVFYGHFIEKLYYAGSVLIFPELKLIYSFHVPLFFFLSGVFFKIDNRPLGLIVLNKFKTRIMPTFFFGLIAIPWFLFLDKFTVAAVLLKAKAYLLGHPELNWVTWFLVCLFSLEIIISLISKCNYFSSRRKVVVIILIFFVVGWLLASNAELITLKTGIPKNFWFINEVFTAGGFYLLGYLLKDILFKPSNRLYHGVYAAISGVVLIYTYNLNNGPFYESHKIVLMNASSHGNYLLFVVTALMGISFIIFGVRFLGIKAYFFDFIAKNTLIYLGLNGLCLFFIDVKIIYKIAYIPTDPLFINLYAVIYVTTIMIIFMPVIWFIRKYVPKWLVP